MPELPEVETVASGLRKLLIGETIKGAQVLREQSVAYPLNKRKFCQALCARRVVSVSRRGKYLLIDLSEGDMLVVHLRMSGRLLVKKAGAPPDRFLRVKIALESGKELHFEDMRVFGRIWYVPERAALLDIVSGIKSLGVEPLDDLDFSYLKKRLEGKSQPIKNALLDQRIIAGIGNIYADESLFLAGIRPNRKAGSLKPAETKRLVATVKSVLSEAIEQGGSTLRDYRKADGVNGNYQSQAWVYGRFAQDCRKCGSGAKIERIKLAGRSTHYCPKCQK